MGVGISRFQGLSSFYSYRKEGMCILSVQLSCKKELCLAEVVKKILGITNWYYHIPMVNMFTCFRATFDFLSNGKLIKLTFQCILSYSLEIKFFFAYTFFDDVFFIFST